MAEMKNSCLFDGFLMNAPADRSQGSQRIARFDLANHYYAKGGQRQTFAKVICYNRAADYVLDQSDFRKGDMLQVEGKLKSFKYPSGDGYTSYGLEIMGNKVICLKKGKEHVDGGDEEYVGLPEGT